MLYPMMMHFIKYDIYLKDNYLNTCDMNNDTVKKILDYMLPSKNTKIEETKIEEIFNKIIKEKSSTIVCNDIK